MITKIYLVTNCYGDPNKVYIGKTKNCRFKNHVSKYGYNITYDYIDEIDSLDKNKWEPLETYWIEQFKQWGFDVINIRKKGGSGPITQSEQTKQKISKSKLGQKYPIEHGIKISKALKGKHHLSYTNVIKLKMKKSKPIGFGANHSLKMKGKSRPDLKDKQQTFKGRISPNKGNTYKHSIKVIESKYKPITQYDLEGNFIKEWNSIKEARNTLEICNIPLALSGANKTAGKFIWKYKIEDNE